MSQPSRYAVPKQIMAYHIVHVDNLASIISTGGLLSDRAMINRGMAHTQIGMGNIKADRLARPVPCHPGTCVGEYVPFYFCPRSVMLYVIHKRNSSGLAYKGGQGPIVHLEFPLTNLIAYAEERPKRWAYTTGNARAFYAKFATGVEDLSLINWDCLANTDWRTEEVKEAKQSEFLVHRGVPWHVVQRIGVIDQTIRRRVLDALDSARHRPAVVIQRDWYY